MNNVSFFNTSQSWTQPALLKLAVILFGLFQVQVVAAQSQQGGEEQTTQLEQNPPYQQYEVKAGETLYSISKSLDVEIEELREWNELSSNALSVGQVLRYLPTEWSPLTSETQSEAIETGASIIRSTDVETTEFYIVKSGDNLIRIAGAHDMSVVELKC